MAYIILNIENRPTLFEAPERVAANIKDYAFQFLDEINQPDSIYLRRIMDPATGEVYIRLAYDEKDFLTWLNRQPETRQRPVTEAVLLSKQEREIIMDTARKEQDLPHDLQKYPWFQFK